MAQLSEIERELHEQFSNYGAQAREWLRKCELLLPQIAKFEIWKKKGFASIYEYAAKLAGMSRTSVDTALWVLKKIENKPLLQAVAQDKGLARVRPVANFATPETESFWAEKARSMSKHTLETYVKDYRLEFCPGARKDTNQVVMELDSKTLVRLEKLKGEKTWNELMLELLDPVEKPAVVQSKSRYVPKSIQKYASAKTSGLCTYPNCKRIATSLHHTQRFALEKVHDPDRLAPVCKAHERLAHLGLIENEDKLGAWSTRKVPDQLDHKFYIDRFVRLYRPT